MRMNNGNQQDGVMDPDIAIALLKCIKSMNQQQPVRINFSI